ncbi:MAG: clan AA aspartic protease, partial [Desulfosarcina sp.]|nr:clan AA aspartic protease [Desulfobacterales bacterium]
MKLIQLSIELSLLIVLVALPSFASAGGRYRVYQDEGGVYLETDQHGGWYVAPEDRADFQVGQTGSYTLREDSEGAYLQIDHRHRHYLGEGLAGSIDDEIESFNRARKPPARPQKTTPVVIHGNHVLVPVTIGYKNREIEVLLLLDTGASIMTLHKNIADRLALPSGYRTRLMTAGGHKIDAGLVQLGSVKFGPYHRSSLAAAVIKNLDTT